MASLTKPTDIASLLALVAIAQPALANEPRSLLTTSILQRLDQRAEQSIGIGNTGDTRLVKRFSELSGGIGSGVRALFSTSWTQDVERLRGESVQTLSDTLSALERLYMAWIPASAALGWFARVPASMLEQQGFASPEERIFSGEQCFRADWLSLWGIVHEFPAVQQKLEQGELPTTAEKGGMYFHSAWLWFRRRYALRSVAAEHATSEYSCAFDTAVPCYSELLENSPNVVLTRLMANDQPYKKCSEWTRDDHSALNTVRWKWLQSVLTQKDELDLAAGRHCAALRFQLLRHAKTCVQRGTLQNADELWQCSIEHAQTLA